MKYKNRTKPEIPKHRDTPNDLGSPKNREIMRNTIVWKMLNQKLVNAALEHNIQYYA